MGSKGCKFISKAGDISSDESHGGFGKLPSEPDEALTEACSCDVLNTKKGLLRGCWGKFTAEAFYRPFPEDDMIKAIRHILIALLSIEKYATREGETLENVEELGEGSFAKVLGIGRVAAKIISDTERVWVHRAAVSNSLVADREGFGPAIFGHGRVQQTLGGHFAGTVIFMERLYGFDGEFSETLSEALLEEVRKISKHGFHNDLKMPNILRRSNGQPVVIDFDLMSQWSVKVAVSSSCIEHDFKELLETEDQSAMFREYYDLFALSLTLENGILYRKVLDRLLYLWGHLEEPVLKTFAFHHWRWEAIRVTFWGAHSGPSSWSFCMPIGLAWQFVCPFGWVMQEPYPTGMFAAPATVEIQWCLLAYGSITQQV